MSEAKRVKPLIDLGIDCYHDPTSRAFCGTCDDIHIAVRELRAVLCGALIALEHGPQIRGGSWTSEEARAVDAARAILARLEGGGK